MELPTVDVIHKESQTPMKINQADFDPEQHEMPGAKKAEKKGDKKEPEKKEPEPTK